MAAHRVSGGERPGRSLGIFFDVFYAGSARWCWRRARGRGSSAPYVLYQESYWTDSVEVTNMWGDIVSWASLSVGSPEGLEYQRHVNVGASRQYNKPLRRWYAGTAKPSRGLSKGKQPSRADAGAIC
jgi:hypothetical protein